LTTMTFTLKDFDRWLGGLAALPARFDPVPAYRVIGVLLTAAVKENFAAGHDPEGRPWAPLKNPRGRRRGGKVLRDTGLLMASFGSGGHHVEAFDRRGGLVWGSNLDRAAWHQHGTRRMPARPMIGFTARISEKVSLVVAEQVVKQLLAGS
jgi:phage gpG-like protein